MPANPASLKIDSSVSAVAYHVIDGPVTFSYAIDAHSAVSRFPGEWSITPWSAEDTAAARKDIGGPEQEPPTEEEQAAIKEHAVAVAEANERLRVRREKLAAERAEAEQIAADEALVASPPPQPDPTRRRPTAKEKRAEFLKLTPEEQAEADKRIGLEPDAPLAAKPAVSASGTAQAAAAPPPAAEQSATGQ